MLGERWELKGQFWQIYFIFVAAVVQLLVEVEQADEEIDDEVAAVEVHLEFELGNGGMCTIGDIDRR